MFLISIFFCNTISFLFFLSIKKGFNIFFLLSFLLFSNNFIFSKNFLLSSISSVLLSVLSDLVGFNITLFLFLSISFSKSSLKVAKSGVPTSISLWPYFFPKVKPLFVAILDTGSYKRHFGSSYLVKGLILFFTIFSILVFSLFFSLFSNILSYFSCLSFIFWILLLNVSRFLSFTLSCLCLRLSSTNFLSSKIRSLFNCLFNSYFF